MLLRISVIEVHEQHFTEYEHQDCPTFANLPPSSWGFGKVGERFFGHRSSFGLVHGMSPDGVTVAERRLIRSSSSIRVINVVTSSMHLQRTTATTVFALLVRNSRRVVGLSIARRCWRRPAALRAHRRRGLQPSRSPLASRLVLELAHLALAVRHRAPAYVPSPCSVVSCLRRPRSCCRCAGGAHRGGRNRPT